jgi:hypothetical protein
MAEWSKVFETRSRVLTVVYFASEDEEAGDDGKDT